MVTTVAQRLMGQRELADRLGVSRQRVQQIVSRPDFPPPYATLANGRVWTTEDVEAWIAEHRPAPDGE